ncbi:MAG TPA: THUMP domain-containing protein [Polyangia bacterium]|nr:THUMP domain-containing protein [Polyangia bacterium]
MFRFFVTCARGTEGALRREIAGMRIAGAKGDHGGVWFEGPLEMGMRVCLHARVAVRVLLQLGTFAAADAQGLYAGARTIAWRDWLTTKSAFAVHASVRDTPALTHSGFVALKVKDAIADALRDALGARPDVDTKSPDVAVVLHLAAGKAGIFLDLAAEPLHRRGYRVAMVDAPLKETLAAAVLLLGGAHGDAPFIDPMCGSGTLAIEHALAARGIAPGLRRRFGFERWPTLPPEALAAWDRLRAESDQAAREAIRETWPPIVCADVDGKALAAARQNAAAASVDDAIVFEQADVATLERRWPVATLATNPPYGERLKPAELEATYRAMGRAFERLAGWRVIVLSGNPAIERAIRRKPSVSHRLWNGPLEARLLRYDMDGR